MASETEHFKAEMGAITTRQGTSDYRFFRAIIYKPTGKFICYIEEFSDIPQSKNESHADQVMQLLEDGFKFRAQNKEGGAA